MARITETLDVPVTPEQAFDYVADFTTTANWDPGISGVRRLDTGPLARGARFKVQYDIGPAAVPLHYEITTYERPLRVVLTTVGPFHRGKDDVTFESAGEGTRVTWDARFALRGPGRLLDPLLAIGFQKVGREAVRGLEKALRSLDG